MLDEPKHCHLPEMEGGVMLHRRSMDVFSIDLLVTRGSSKRVGSKVAYYVHSMSLAAAIRITTDLVWMPVREEVPRTLEYTALYVPTWADC